LLCQVDFDAMMILDWEEKPVQEEPLDGAGLVQADRLEKGRKPAAVVGKFQELVQVSEQQLRLKGLALADNEAMLFHDVADFLAIGGTFDHAINVQLGGAGEPAQQLAIGLRLELGKAALGGAEIGPVAPVLEPAPHLGG